MSAKCWRSLGSISFFDQFHVGRHDIVDNSIREGIANRQEVALRLAEDILLQRFDSERLQWMIIGAYCPWNLSTVPTRTPLGRRRLRTSKLAVQLDTALKRETANLRVDRVPYSSGASVPPRLQLRLRVCAGRSAR
jgi:hypothetical protein